MNSNFALRKDLFGVECLGQANIRMSTPPPSHTHTHPFFLPSFLSFPPPLPFIPFALSLHPPPLPPPSNHRRPFPAHVTLFLPACLSPPLPPVEIAQQHGAAAKFPGSGGAVVGICSPDKVCIHTCTRAYMHSICMCVYTGYFINMLMNVVCIEYVCEHMYMCTACMHVCIHVHMYVCMCVCIYVCVCV